MQIELKTIKLKMELCILCIRSKKVSSPSLSPFLSLFLSYCLSPFVFFSTAWQNSLTRQSFCRPRQDSRRNCDSQSFRYPRFDLGLTVGRDRDRDRGRGRGGGMLRCATRWFVDSADAAVSTAIHTNCKHCTKCKPKSWLKLTLQELKTTFRTDSLYNYWHARVCTYLCVGVCVWVYIRTILQHYR